MYQDSQGLFHALQKAFKEGKHIDFFGSYMLPEDPLVSDHKRVRMVIHDIWKVTGYHFTWVYKFILDINS